MSDTVKHSDDEEIVTLTYTWGQVKNFLHEHGRPATTRKRAHAMARRMRVGPLGVRRRITHPPIRQPGIPEGGGRVPMAVERLNPRRTVRP